MPWYRTQHSVLRGRWHPLGHHEAVGGVHPHGAPNGCGGQADGFAASEVSFWLFVCQKTAGFSCTLMLCLCSTLMGVFVPVCCATAVAAEVI
jgi:hypothetical protein